MKYHARIMSQSRNGWLLVLVLMTLAIGSITPNSGCAQHAPVSALNAVTQADAQTDMVLADMVLDWNANAANAIVGVAGLRPGTGQWLAYAGLAALITSGILLLAITRREYSWSGLKVLQRF